MTAAANLPSRPLTLDDVTRIAEADPSHRFELSEGNLVVMPPGTWRHQEISGLLFAWSIANGYRGRVNIAPGVQTATDSLNGRISDLVVTTGPIADETVWLPRDGRARGRDRLEGARNVSTAGSSRSNTPKPAFHCSGGWNRTTPSCSSG